MSKLSNPTFSRFSAGVLAPLANLLGVGFLILASVPLAGWVSDTLIPPNPHANFGGGYEFGGFSRQPQTTPCGWNQATCGEPQTLDPRVQKVLARLQIMGFKTDEDTNLEVFAKTVIEAEDRYHVPHELLVGIAGVESAFNSQAHSIKNAQGLFQLQPATAAFLWPEFQKTLPENDPIRELDPINDLGDVRLSTLMGAYYIAYLETMFQGRTHLALASYNAGPANVQRALLDGRVISSSYVFKVYAMTEDFRHGHHSRL